MNRPTDRYPLRSAALQVLLAVLGVSACTSNPAPSGWLPGATETPSDPYGAWVEVRVEAETTQRTLAGELIAVHADSFFVLTGNELHGIPVDSTAAARVAWFDSGYGMLALWTGLGSVSTVSHGLFSGITFPLWVLGGTLATAAQSRIPIVDYKPDKTSAETLSSYARFPQGIPAGLDRGLLTSRRGQRRH